MPPQPQHTVSIAFVRGAVQRLDAAQRQAVLQRAAIAPELLAADAARVPAAAFAALWLAVGEALDDEFFGLDSRRMKVGSFALLCHALGGQATVDRALRQGLRGFSLFLDDIGVERVASVGSNGPATSVLRNAPKSMRSERTSSGSSASMVHVTS